MWYVSPQSGQSFSTRSAIWLISVAVNCLGGIGHQIGLPSLLW